MESGDLLSIGMAASEMANTPSYTLTDQALRELRQMMAWWRRISRPGCGGYGPKFPPLATGTQFAWADTSAAVSSTAETFDVTNMIRWTGGDWTGDDPLTVKNTHIPFSADSGETGIIASIAPPTSGKNEWHAVYFRGPEQEVVTDYQVSGVTIQKKTRTLKGQWIPDIRVGQQGNRDTNHQARARVAKSLGGTERANGESHQCLVEARRNLAGRIADKRRRNQTSCCTYRPSHSRPGIGCHAHASRSRANGTVRCHIVSRYNAIGGYGADEPFQRGSAMVAQSVATVLDNDNQLRAREREGTGNC